MDVKRTALILEKFIAQRVKEANAKGVVLGLSGGIDSALAGILATRALGKEAVLGLFLPSSSTPNGDRKIVLELAEAWGIELIEHSIQPILNAFSTILAEDITSRSLSWLNLQPRSRQALWYYYANSRNKLVLGTSNKSELMTGYFTKFGDGAVDILPMGDIYKKNVRELAVFLELPEQVISKTPSAGLWEGQTDEKDLGMSYSTLDRILQGLEHFGSTSAVANRAETSEQEVEKIQSMIWKSEHKRRCPIILKLGYRTPGNDWRINL